MVLFDEDPVTLIHATSKQFKIGPDRDCLARIDRYQSGLAARRQERIDAQNAALLALVRRLNHLEGRYQYDEERHNAGRHAGEMLKMDRDKFALAKGANEAEIEGERLSGELAALKRQLEALEREGVEGGEREGGEGRDDEVVLKLQFYRSLGIDAVKDPATGEYKRAVIRNASRGDVNVVNLDGSLGQEHHANMFWDSL